MGGVLGANESFSGWLMGGSDPSLYMVKFQCKVCSIQVHTRTTDNSKCADHSINFWSSVPSYAFLRPPFGRVCCNCTHSTCVPYLGHVADPKCSQCKSRHANVDLGDSSGGTHHFGGATAQPAAGCAEAYCQPAEDETSSSAIGDTSSPSSTVQKVRKAKNNLHLFFVPTTK